MPSRAGIPASPGAPATCTRAVEVLSAGLPSMAFVVTVAVLLSGPGTVGRTIRVMVAEAPLLRVPRVQMTGLGAPQLP